MTHSSDRAGQETAWHLVQRARERRTCFRVDRDYRNYAYWLHRYSLRYEVRVHAWVFMPEHVHVLASSRDGWACPEMLQAIARQYQGYASELYGARQSLWDESIGVHPVQGEGRVLCCYRYIEQHPVRSGLTCDAHDYDWSSHACNALGHSDALCRPHGDYLALGGDRIARRLAYQAMFAQPLENAAMSEIRRCLSEGVGL